LRLKRKARSALTALHTVEEISDRNFEFRRDSFQRRKAWQPFAALNVGDGVDRSTNEIG